MILICWSRVKLKGLMDAEENNEIFNPDAAQTAPNTGYAVAPVAAWKTEN